MFLLIKTGYSSIKIQQDRIGIPVGSKFHRDGLRHHFHTFIMSHNNFMTSHHIFMSSHDNFMTSHHNLITSQIEKGPVDYITGNARYALHEKNLLSKITVFNKLNVMVYLDDDPYLKDTAYTPLTSCQVISLSFF